MAGNDDDINGGFIRKETRYVTEKLLRWHKNGRSKPEVDHTEAGQHRGGGFCRRVRLAGVVPEP